MRNKKLLELWSSIFILLFLFTFLGSFFFIFPHDSDYLAVIEPFFSFCPPVFMIVYLIIFGPLGLSGFDERLSKYLVFTSGSLLSILLFYSLLNSLETLFDKNSIIIAALFLSILVVFLQLKIVDILYKIDSNKIDNFICFIKKTNFELF